MSFSGKDRASLWQSLETDPPELLIIGGGVVGCSLAAHAAHLGLDVVLLEKGDLAQGASGHSTGLAHGGLRYLAQGQFWYVFKEGRERNRLEDLAPHWVRPFNFILPAYKEDPFPFWVEKLGTWIYDLMGWVDALLTRRPLVRRHRTLSADQVKARIPGIRAEGLKGGIEYFVDAKLQDARFTLGYAQQAAQHGARILTYAEATSVVLTPGSNPKVSCTDRLSGKTMEISSRLVINAAGGWIDEVRRNAGLSWPLLQKSRGIHLVVDYIVDAPLIISSSVKGKVFFVLPIDSDRTLVGTTDTPISTTPDETAPEPTEIRELLQSLFHYFPYLKQGANLIEAIEAYKRVHVRDIYWSVRPLLGQGGPSFLASREHRLVKDLPAFWSIPGVKLTAARAAGLEAAVESWKQLRKAVPMPVVTWDSLPGGELYDYDRFVRDAQKRFRLGARSDETIAYLISTYGTRYIEVLQWAQREGPFSEPIVPEEPWILAQIPYAAHEEMVLTLNDFLWRRTKWAHLRDLPDTAVERIARVLGQVLDWPEEEILNQIRQYRSELSKHRLG